MPSLRLYNKLAATPARSVPFPVPVLTAPAVIFKQFLRGCGSNRSAEIALIKNSVPRKKMKPEALVTAPSLPCGKYQSSLEKLGAVPEVDPFLAII